MKKLIILLFVPGLLSCGQGNQEKGSETQEEVEEALYNEMMAIHDEVMPKMEDIMNLKTRLKKGLDQPGQDSKERRDAIERLDDADEAMMQWMRSLKPKDSLDGHQAIMDYYEAQKDAIIGVKADMLNAIAEAEEVLKKN